MEATVRRVRVVLVSPGDVHEERAAAQSVIEELNRGEAAEHGLLLSLWRWKTDAQPGLHLHGPQGQIDRHMRIETTALVIGIFWKRFGTCRPSHTSLAERGRRLLITRTGAFDRSCRAARRLRALA